MSVLGRGSAHGDNRDIAYVESSELHATDKVWEVLLCAAAATRRIDEEVTGIECTELRLNLRNELRVRLVTILFLKKPRVPWLARYLGNGKFFSDVFRRRFTAPNHHCYDQREEAHYLHSFAQDDV